MFNSGIKRKKRQAESNNRLHVIMAIIFLFAGAVIIRLYCLQVLDYDFYTAMASDQHQVFSQLDSIRGNIFIQDNKEISSDNLYPIATNKELALVYAVPKNIKNPEEVANKFYEILDQASVEKEVDNLLSNDEDFNNLIKQEEDADALDEERQELRRNKMAEFKAIKREAEINLRKKNIVDEYLKKLSKKDDPYEPIKKKVDEETLKKITDLNFEGINYIMETHRYYPEGEMNSHISGFVGYNNEKKVGMYGLEGFFNDELFGKAGSIKAERAATGKLIIIKDREYIKPENGNDIILTINRSIQYEACKKLEESAMRHGADGGSVVVMDPKTGAIIAMCSWPNYDPNFYTEVKDAQIYNNPVIFEQFEPGSTVKVLTMAAGLDKGKVAPGTLYNDTGSIMIEGWAKPIKNSDYESAGAHGMVDMITVLEKSLNTGAIFVMKQVGYGDFASYMKNFGFGEKTGIELETESAGNINSLTRKTIRPVEAATASFGQGITTTPLQMINSYAAIANGGILMKPYLVNEIVRADGQREKTQPQQVRRVISERTAMLLSGMMVKVVDNGHAKRAKIKGYYVAGKTGTAQVADKSGGYSKDNTIHTFIGFAPVNDPKFVMLTKLDNPKDSRFAESSAVPLFGEIGEFIMNYYQIPKEREE